MVYQRDHKIWLVQCSYLKCILLHRWYETCTKELLTQGSFENYYWCPTIDQVDSESKEYNGGDRGYCTSYGYPEDNGCPDHYDAVRTYCCN